MSRIGLGLAALGRPAYITLGRDVDIGDDRARDAMQRRCHAMLDAAYAAGIRYVDAARSYGMAEEFLASWLATRHGAPGAVTVGSKWGYRYTGAWEMNAAVHETKDHSLAMFHRQLPESVTLLGAHLALYQVHSATFESGVLGDHAVLRALAELHDSGIAVGLTVSGPRQADVVRYALDVEVDGVNPFSTVQATWNVLEPSVGPALAEAKGRGLGILVKEVLANGRLSGAPAGGRAGAAAPDSPVPAVAALAEVAARREVPLDQVAVAAALDQPWADVVLSGAVTPAQLDSNIAALVVSLTDEDRSRLSSAVEEPVEYWDRRSALPWS